MLTDRRLRRASASGLAPCPTRSSSGRTLSSARSPGTRSCGNGTPRTCGGLPGLEFMRALWVCDVSGGPFQFTATKPGTTPLGLEEAHRDLRPGSSPAEFDEVAAELGRSLDFAKVPRARRRPKSWPPLPPTRMRSPPATGGEKARLKHRCVWACMSEGARDRALAVASVAVADHRSSRPSWAESGLSKLGGGRMQKPELLWHRLRSLKRRTSPCHWRRRRHLRSDGAFHEQVLPLGPAVLILLDEPSTSRPRSALCSAT